MASTPGDKPDSARGPLAAVEEAASALTSPAARAAMKLLASPEIQQARATATEAVQAFQAAGFLEPPPTSKAGSTNNPHLEPGRQSLDGLRGAKREHRRRLPDMTNDRFRRLLDDAGRRLMMGDTSGSISASDRKLIEGNRKLSKHSVYGLMGIGKTAFNVYLGPKRCNIDWDAWKDGIERRYRGN